MPAAEFALLRVIMVRRPNLLWEEAAVQLFPLVFYKYQGRQIKDALYSRGWSRKKLHFVARERDNYLRALFCQLFHAPGQQFNARQFVFVDETLKKGQDLVELQDKLWTSLWTTNEERWTRHATYDGC